VSKKLKKKGERSKIKKVTFCKWKVVGRLNVLVIGNAKGAQKGRWERGGADQSAAEGRIP